MQATTRGRREFSERNGVAGYKWDVGNFEACEEGLGKVAAELGR